MIKFFNNIFVCAAVIFTFPVPVFGQSFSGAYLAGQNAASRSDFEAAGSYYIQALAQDPNNAKVAESAIFAQIALGDVLRAKPLAAVLEARGVQSQIAHMTIIATLFYEENYEGYLAREVETSGVGPLVDGLLSAWAQVGLKNRVDALAQFDKIAEQSGLQGFALYHKAMALGALGDFEAAEEIFAKYDSGPLQQTRRGILARAEILSQLGRNEDALASIRAAFGSTPDPELTVFAKILETGGTLPFSHITSARDGAAEVFYSVAGALQQEAGADYTLLYARVASFLRPDHIDTLLLSAELLESLDQYKLANTAYKGVPADHSAFHAAELGRADVLRQSGKPDASIEVLEQLAKRFDDLAIVYSTLGDVLRQQEQFEEAVSAYDRALELTKDGARGSWFLHYARAISLERLEEWPRAESDFRKALELNPGQPQVLNYLGYSLVEKQVKLKEALSMIEQAVTTSPESGYIVDSLGWVLYRLGRYQEATQHMERAVELMPIDPVVNDHLGDVYWAVGREREAQFQWMRALSFVDPKDTDGEADPDRMRRKLEVGLDQVLQEEDAEPLKVTDEN